MPVGAKKAHLRYHYYSLLAVARPGCGSTNMPEYLETQRLLLRPFKDADAAAAFEWCGHREAMRYSPNGPDRSMARTANWAWRQKARARGAWSRYGAPRPQTAS